MFVKMTSDGFSGELCASRGATTGTPGRSAQPGGACKGGDYEAAVEDYRTAQRINPQRGSPSSGSSWKPFLRTCRMLSFHARGSAIAMARSALHVGLRDS